VYRFNFLSINRFERKKNLDLAISAFSLIRSVSLTLPGGALQEATLTMAGNFYLLLLLSVACSVLYHYIIDLKMSNYLLC